MPIKSLDSEVCTGCKICVDACPEDVLRMNEAERKAQIVYPEDCIACWVCEWFCPVKCIEVSRDPARPSVADY
jgi:NAD-dependent dihydropyrimidine dehydrogenase PreA subunit